MNSFKQWCVELRKQDYSLGEIVKITKRPKSSVYVHIQNLPLSPRKWQQIRAAHGARALQIAARRRGKSAKSYRVFDEWTIDTVCLIAHLLFDGEIKRTHCTYHNRSDTLLYRVGQCMKQIYDPDPKRYRNASTGVSRICYFNVAFAAYIKDKANELLTTVPSFPKELKIQFLRSFFDDEGCMDYRLDRNLRRIRGYQKNVKILGLVQTLLKDVDIEARVQMPNEVVIIGKKNLTRFKEEIGFSPGVCINGNRSNSIWKKPLEKREILRRAIASFRPVGSNGVHRGVRIR